MAPTCNRPYRPSIIAKVLAPPAPANFRVEQPQRPQVRPSIRTFSEATQTRAIKHNSARSCTAPARLQPEVRRSTTHDTNYPPNHLLSIPQEVRDAILQYLDVDEEVLGRRPTSGYESYRVTCRQLYEEEQSRWNCRHTLLVPSGRVDEFIRRTLVVTDLKSKAQTVKSLFIEIDHGAPIDVFCQLAKVLRHSTQLEQLHLFGVGTDGYSVKTSSIAHSCGKHDISTGPLQGRLQIDGQQHQKRLTLVNSIPWLQNLKVLVLDNFNLPLLQAHVIKNKPKLEKLHIAADPRSVLHMDYPRAGESGLNNMFFPVVGKMPPVKQLRIDSNAIYTASQITTKLAGTLESLEWVIPDSVFQTDTRVKFYKEAIELLSSLHSRAKQLKELRICIHGPMSEAHSLCANFMGALNACLTRLRSLQLVELHANSESQFFADEFVQSLPPSVTRLFVSDLLVRRDLGQLCAAVSTKTGTSPSPEIELVDAVQIGDDLGRKDYIEFGQSKLGFVSYEYDGNLLAGSFKKQDKDMRQFLKLNGRLLDKERNRHLERLAGKHIPPKESAIEGDVEDVESTLDDLRSAATSQEIEDNQNELADCILGEANEYFGNEDVAEVVFRHEPAAKGSRYSYPAIVEVEDEFKLCNHWLSK